MAQNYVGSNNINLLEPLGQFGTRLLGGKDAASERYIFTQLNKLTRLIFPQEDDQILTYLNDDGTLVEPIYYVPIIPMVLINGSKGIGTGFSTDIMCYNPLQIMNKIELMLKNKEHDIDINPYYHGFKGSIDFLNGEKKYMIKGIYEKVGDNKIHITELPIGQWTEDYKVFLESLMDTKKKDKTYVRDFTDMSTDISVDFTVEFYPGTLASLMGKTTDISGNAATVSGLEKLLKLYTTHAITNMHLFDADEHLRKFESPSEIIEEYYDVRLEFYDKRRTHQIDAIKKELVILSNKARFINENLDDTIDLRRKKREEIIKLLTDKQYDLDSDTSSYNYLIKMPMDSVTEEAVNKLINEKHGLEAELEILETTTIQTMWLTELEELKKEYIKFTTVIVDNGKKTIIKRKKK